MGDLPPGIFALVIAVLSASAGALLTWVVMYVVGEERPKSVRPPSEDGAAATDDLLRVARINGDPAIFVQGERRRHLRDIEDRETGQDTVWAIKAVLAFAEGWLPALQEKAVSSEAADRQSTPGAVGPSAPLHERDLFSTRRDRGALASEPLKLFEEIDSLIQRRLEERPELGKQGIRLTRDVHGRLLIYVGRQRYQSADEIPDDEVSVFIQETIRMWENQ